MDPVFSCSLDDGYPSDMKAVELLCKNGINATFYIPAKNREGPKVVSKEQLRQIGNGFEVGGHTYDHCYLKDLPAQEVSYQVIEGKNYLEDILGRKIAGFCYPGGEYRVGQIHIIRSAGFEYARTTMNLRFETGVLPFEMPTTVQFYPHDKSIFLRNFVKGGCWMKRGQGLRVALRHHRWIDRIYDLFEDSLRRGEVFHLWGHSKEIDEINGWQEFDRFLSYVAETISPENRLTNGQLAGRYFTGSIACKSS